jgi:hypothetical protein
VADIDGNGRVDIVSISNAAGAVYWHEQVTPRSWVQRTISTSAFGVESLTIGDLVSNHEPESRQACVAPMTARPYRTGQ